MHFVPIVFCLIMTEKVCYYETADKSASTLNTLSDWLLVCPGCMAIACNE